MSVAAQARQCAALQLVNRNRCLRWTLPQSLQLLKTLWANDMFLCSTCNVPPGTNL